MIYFLLDRDAAPPLVKIGTTTQLSRRLKVLAAEFGPGLELIGVVDGGRRDERALHDRFAGLRVMGEWFRYEGALAAFIALKGRPWDGRDDRAKVDIRLQVDREFYRRIRAVARSERQTVAGYIRTCLVEHMRRQEVIR